MYKTYFRKWKYHVNPFPKYTDFIDYVDKKLLPLGFKKEGIGISQDGEFKIYGYSLSLDKPVYWIDADIHGSEWHSCYYTLDFICDVWGDGHIDKRTTKKIRDTFGVYYIPSVNPWGYENVKYTQSRGINLNRNFDNLWHIAAVKPPFDPNAKGDSALSESEIQAVVSKFNKVKPYIAINCHTTTGGTSGIDMNARYPYYKLLSKDILQTLKLTAPNAGTMEWNTQFAPTANGWYATQTSKEGTPTFASILEHQSNTDEFDFGYTALLTIAISIINFKNNGKYNTNSINDILS